MRTTKAQALAFGLAALGLLALTDVPANAADKPGAGLKICISLDKVNASREGQLKLWRRAADELGVQLIEQVAGEDAQRQSSQVDTCIAQKVAGIISIPWDYEAVLQDIERAHAANIPFVTMDQAPAETNTVDFHIGADPHADGMHAGQRLIALVGDKPTKVVDLQGALSHFNGQGRDKGFKDAIAGHPNITIVSEVPTEWHPEPVLAGMENALQANPDLGAVFAASDGLLPPVWSALQKVNRYTKIGQPNHVVVLSIDGDPQGCSYVRDGWMDAGYAQPFALMTRKTIEVIIDIAKSGKKPAEADRFQLIPGVEYTQANFAEASDKVWGCLK
jgi:ABC-type sugar transport system substrate-binding protein